MCMFSLDMFLSNPCLSTLIAEDFIHPGDNIEGSESIDVL